MKLQSIGTEKESSQIQVAYSDIAAGKSLYLLGRRLIKQMDMKPIDIIVVGTILAGLMDTAWNHCMQQADIFTRP